jgi:hypothetical protein
MAENIVKQIFTPKTVFILERLIFSVLIFLVTFPKTAFEFSTGLDPSCYWAYNYLFAYDFKTLTSIIYTYGPLGFLRGAYPVGNNILIALIFHTITRFSFIWLGIRFGIKHGQLKMLASVAVTGLIAFFAGVDMIMTGIVYLLVVESKGTDRRVFVYAAFLVAYLGLLIKSSVGLISFSIIGLHMIYELFYTRNFKRLLYDVAAFLGAGTLVGVAVFGNPLKLVLLFKHYIQLSGSYTHGMTFHDENNYWLLALMMLLTFLSLFIVRSKQYRYHFIIFSFALFASWKHAMVRQDTPHTFTLFQFLLFFFATAVVYVPAYRKYLAMTGTAVLLLFYANMYNTRFFPGKYMEIAGVQNVSETMFQTRKLHHELYVKSMQNISSMVLDDETRTLIGNRPVDVFPSELMYVCANKLNWKPRPTLQSLPMGAWYDNYSASHFGEKDGIELVLFHFYNSGNAFTAEYIDDQLLLNVEPMTMFRMFNHYNILRKNERFILLEHTGQKKFKDFKDIGESTATWNTWIDVPATEDGIVFCGFDYSRSLLGWLKTFLFRDEYYFITYAFAGGDMATYRFTPDIAKNGIWINPLVRELHTDFFEPVVEKIMFTTTDERMVSPSIKLKWKHAGSVNPEKDTVRFRQSFSAFGKTKDLYADSSLLVFTLDGNTITDHLYWNIQPESVDRTAGCSGHQSFLVQPGGFSPTLKLPGTMLLEHFGSHPLRADIRVTVFQEPGSKADVVISIQDKDQTIYWKGFPLPANQKNTPFSYRIPDLITERITEESELAVYIWNTGTHRLNLCTITVLLSNQ